MKRILVLYATREGQTRRIAEHIGDALIHEGWETDILDARSLPKEFSLAPYGTAILAASVHVGKHEPEMVAFVKAHRSELDGLRAIFLSVSGTESAAENPAATDSARQKSAALVQTMIQTFLQETEWTPAHIFPVAGALMYREYNPLLRFIMRMIARSEGASTDTSCNIEYTDWEALDRFMTDWIMEVDGAQAVGHIG